MRLVAGVPRVNLQENSKVTTALNRILEAADNHKESRWKYANYVGVGTSGRS
jgi:hypothetical protein